MMAVVLYKEYREHRSIWLVLALVAALALLGVGTAFADDNTMQGRDVRDALQPLQPDQDHRGKLRPLEPREE